MQRLSPDQIRAVYDRGPEAVVDLITQRFDIIDALEARVSELERQVHRNSRNSSQPPSADGLKKPPPRSQRRPSGRQRGGQPGHPGDTLKMVVNPEIVIRHPVGVCEACGGALDRTAVDHVVHRQVFDIPPLHLTVTEHQAEVKICPTCRHTTMGTFPVGVPAPTQYGPYLLGLSTYLQTFQMLPIDRIRDFFHALWGHAPSGRTLSDAAERAAEAVAPVLDRIQTALRHAPVVHVDETGFRVDGRLWWIHTATTDDWTLYGLHRRRGQEGIDALGVMSKRDGVAVHDFWKPYYLFTGRHALCNAHLLRDLTGLHEITGDGWVVPCSRLLVDMHHAAVAVRDAGQPRVSPALDASYHALYDVLVRQGRRRHPDPAPAGHRGRVKRDLAQNLLTRLETHRAEILAFFEDLTIPFDNNAAERALRMMKMKQKVSGSFRTEQGGTIFAAIRSDVVTARQQGQSPLGVLQTALAGEPWMPH